MAVDQCVQNQGELQIEKEEAMKSDDFFKKENCDRCGNNLNIRTMSWFTDETICSVCSDKEDRIKQQMRMKGLNPDDYEGCGYIPEMETTS